MRQEGNCEKSLAAESEVTTEERNGVPGITTEAVDEGKLCCSGDSGPASGGGAGPLLLLLLLLPLLLPLQPLRQRPSIPKPCGF